MESLFERQVNEGPRPQPSFTTFDRKNEMRNYKVMPVLVQTKAPIYLLLSAIFSLPLYTLKSNLNCTEYIFQVSAATHSLTWEQ